MATVHGRGSAFIQMSEGYSCGGYRTRCVDPTTAVLHAVADRFLVNVQTDVAHSLLGGASLMEYKSAGAPH